ncbi:putative transcription factor bZIP family [Helianthus annuus]|nr:putative transcription factor bZIP family [Helianthus annuus]
MDDVWKDISSLPSLHHPTTTHHFQDFLAPPAPRPGGGATFHHPPAPPVHEPLTTMLSLSTSGNSEHDQDPPHNTTSIIVVTSPHVQETSPPEYTEKFKRLMKNRESAARSRARKQARADELEEEVLRLTKENAKLRRLQKEVFLCLTF